LIFIFVHFEAMLMLKRLILNTRKLERRLFKSC
jgi:hypothetical protein